MASNVEIANRALTKIGTNRIISLDDNTKEAREVKSMFAIVRDAELRAHNWHFTIKRTSLPAHADVPAFGFARQFRLPADNIKALQIGEFYPGVDLSDYVNGDNAEYRIENGFILTDYPAPLKYRYVARIEDPSLFDALFVEAFSCKLAMELAEPITQSSTKREQASNEYKFAIREAVRANAIETPPTRVADDTWTLARL